ncbi:MAG: hypothetical protein ACXU9U_05455 [Parachlamydiaceae bacterium]
MQVTEQFSFYSNNETCAQTILNGLTHLFDPLPSSNLDPFVDILLRISEVLKRIGFVAYSLLLLPIYKIGSAIDKARSFVVYNRHKPTDFNSSTYELPYFPEDTYREIALNSEIKDMIALSQTCKKARHLILFSVLPHYINSAHTSLQQFNFHPICLDHVLQGIGNQLSYLKLTKITSQVAHRWITFCPNLTHLHIESLRNTRILNHTKDWFCPLVEKGILKIEKLSYLSLMCCQLGEREANQIATLESLTYLNLYGNPLLTADENALILPESIPPKNRGDQEKFQFHLTQLTYLNLGFIHTYSDPI